MKDLQIRALLDDGTVLTSMTSSTNWTRLYALEIRIEAIETLGKRAIDRTLMSRFFPRNILSN